MRFEIGPGGGFVVLVGLLGLSAGVFFLGMISGREMAQSELGHSQLATAYPMPPAASAPIPSPAAVGAAPAPAPAPAARAAVAASAQKPKPAAERPAVAERAAPSRRAIASAAPPQHAPPERAAETDQSYAGAEASAGAEERASAPPPEEHRSYAATHSRGYNIVIDAAMDRAEADRMVARLLALGYTPRIVPAPMNGRTWYRVQVGPYPSADDARAAQAQLRAAYTARYVNRTSANGGGGSAADPAQGAAGPSD